MSLRQRNVPRWVRQEHARGCGAAVLAMVAGLSYSEARDLLQQCRSTSHKGDWETEGVTHDTMDEALAMLGYYVQHQWVAWYCDRDEEAETGSGPVWKVREGDTWPPEPWAPIHYCGVAQPSGAGHFVVMLADGRVLDPLQPGFHSLTDWPTVRHVVGVLEAAPLALTEADWNAYEAEFRESDEAHAQAGAGLDSLAAG